MLARSTSTITAESVDQLIRKSWPSRRDYPNLAACNFIATRIKIAGVQEKKRVRDVRNEVLPKLMRKIKENTGRLVDDLRVAKEHHFDPYDFRRSPEYASWPPEVQKSASLAFPAMDVIDKIVEAEDALNKLLSAIQPYPDRANDARLRPNHARFIADGLKLAWPKAPRSPKPELCAFLKDALAAIDVNYEEATISDMLRGRQGRRRSGMRKII
jgi:hypothetical protein